MTYNYDAIFQLKIINILCIPYITGVFYVLLFLIFSLALFNNLSISEFDILLTENKCNATFSNKIYVK